MKVLLVERGEPFSLPLDEERAESGTSSHSPFLDSLSGSLGIEPADWRTGVQPMIAAFSHSSEGKPRRIFDKAYGLEDSSLPLPGGHGQCFHVLAGVLAELHGQGIRFA